MMQDTDRQVFDAWAPHYDDSVAQSSGYYERYDDVLDSVAQIAVRSGGRRVLDVGAGTGNLAIRLLSCGAEVVGLDPSERMLEVARRKAGASGAVFVRADDPFLSIPFPDASFDAVVSTYAFHHVPNASKRDAIGEMVRVLKPCGVIVIGDVAFPHASAERSALREHSWLEEEHFTRINELRGAAQELGLDLRATQFTEVTWVFRAAFV